VALLFVDSFDHYKIGEMTKKWSSAGIFDEPGSIQVGTGRCGSNCYRQDFGYEVHRGVNPQGTPTRGFCGFAYRNIQSLSTTKIMGVSGTLFGDNPLWTAYFSASGAIDIHNGQAGQLLVASTPAGLIHQNEWAFLEFGWTIGRGTGAIIVRVNNIEVLNATGLWLAGDPPGLLPWRAFLLTTSSNATNEYDDLYVLDDVDDGGSPPLNTFLGDVRIQYLRPIADGANTAWTVVGGGTHANAVDKNYSSELTTPSIQSNVVGATDTNEYDNPTIGVGLAFGVQVSALAVKDESGPRTIATVVRAPSGATAISASQAPSEGASTYRQTVYGRNPTTGAPWTIAEVSAAQFGVRVTG